MADVTTPSDDQEAGDCNLIVNYLPSMMSQEEVRRLFSRAGSVELCRLVKDKRTRQSLGYAFVRFRSRSMANRAIQTFNGFRIQNKTIKVSIARPRCSRLRGANVYVSGLERTMTSADLDELFRPYGTIISCRVLCDEQTGLSRGVAFVLFNLRSEAEAAIRALNATLPNGAKRPIRLKFATRPTTGLRRPSSRLLPLATLALPFIGASSSCVGPLMPFVGPTPLAASTGLPPVAQLTSDELDVIRRNLATTSNDDIVHGLNNNQRSPTDAVIRQVAFVVRTRNQEGEGSTPNKDQQQHQHLLDSEREKGGALGVAMGGPAGSLQSSIVVRNLPDERVWRLFGETVEGCHPLHSPSAHGSPNIGRQETSLKTRISPQEAALAMRSLDGLKMEKFGRGGELEMLTRYTHSHDQQQQQQRSSGDGRLMDAFGQGFCYLGKDADHVSEGQGQGQYRGQTKTISGREEQRMISDDLEMDEVLIPTVECPLMTPPPRGLEFCQGQAIDRRLWTDPTGYAAAINQSACWLQQLQTYGFCCCNQPGYISICTQDVQPTFHLGCS